MTRNYKVEEPSSPLWVMHTLIHYLDVESLNRISELLFTENENLVFEVGVWISPILQDSYYYP